MAKSVAPFVLTRRLKLRPWRDDDLEALVAMNADPVAMRYIGNGSPSTREESQAAIEVFRGEWERWGHGRWAIEERATRVLVGDMGFVRYEEGREDERPELAYFFARPWWGFGLATEAGRAALDWAAETLPWDEAVAVTHPENGASQHVLAKLGFLPDGVYQGRYRLLDRFRRPLTRGSAG